MFKKKKKVCVGGAKSRIVLFVLTMREETDLTREGALSQGLEEHAFEDVLGVLLL